MIFCDHDINMKTIPAVNYYCATGDSFYPDSSPSLPIGITIDARNTQQFSFVDVTLKDGTHIYIDLKTNVVTIKPKSKKAQ